MKLGFYHYYLRERRRGSPRVCHDIRPLLQAYIKHEDSKWKTGFEGEDGEKLLLLQSSHPEVFMLVGTRQQDIIKAVDTHRLTCADLTERLLNNEKAGFAAYFRCNPKMLGLAATLRGPKTAALSRFVNALLPKLGAPMWRLEMQALGSSLTLEQARGLAFVSRTTLRVSPGNALFTKLKQLCARDTEDVASFEIVVRGKRKRNLRDVFTTLTADVTANGLDRLTVRAKHALDDDLADYFVAEDGKLSEEIETGTEKQITLAVANRFAHHPSATECLQDMMLESLYEEPNVQELSRLGDPAHWREHLRTG